MICQVTVSEEGAVTAVVDTDNDGFADDDTAKLAGLALDDMLERAASTAINAWFALRTTDDSADADAA